MGSTAAINPASWGTVADWIAAVGTVSALFFALITLRTELREQRLAEATRRADAERSRRAQARRIVFNIWSVRSGVSEEAEADDVDLPPWQERLRIRVTNFSDLPVYSVRSRVEFGGEALFLNVALMLSPGETRGASTKPKEVDHPRSFGSQELFFVDANGVAWSRGSATSDLEELDDIPRDDRGWPAVDWPAEKEFDLR